MTRFELSWKMIPESRSRDRKRHITPGRFWSLWNRKTLQFFQDWSDNYGMTFWTELQHELLRFICAEDDIFNSVGDHKGEHFPLPSRDVTNACITCSAGLWLKYSLIRPIFLIWNDDTRTMLEMRFYSKVIVEWNITPTLRACVEGVICESPFVINGRETFDNCWRDPNRRNSVFRRSISRSFVSSNYECLEYIYPALQYTNRQVLEKIWK